MIDYLHNDHGYTSIDGWHPGCWVNVIAPTDKELQLLREQFHVPDDFLGDVYDPDERPRIERNDGWVLTIIRIPMYDSEQSIPFFTIPIGVMIKGDDIVTLCYYDNALTTDFILHTQKRCIDVHSPADFILRILNSSAYWFLRYQLELKTCVSAAETELQRSIRNEDLLQLMNIQKSIVIFATSIKGNLMILTRLKRLFYDNMDMELWEDVEIELRQADSTLDIASSILDRTLDTYASVISNNVNAIMKRLTSISVILMAPALIGTFYGMNVNVLINPDNPWAFPALVGLSVIVTLVICIWLKKIRWL